MQIHPAGYYDQDNGGTIPIFKPTMEQFKDFKKFMNAIDSFGKISGLVKVIPPPEWQDKLPNTLSKLETIRVHNPIEQHIIGNRGIYKQTNIEKVRPFTIDQWRNICGRIEHKLPNIGLDRSKFNISSVPKSSGIKKRKRSAETITNRHTKRKTKREINAEEIALAKSDFPVKLEFDPRVVPDVVDEQFFDIKNCQELERAYWRNLTFTQPMYGADMAGSLFDESVKSWNVSKLDNLLNSVNVELPGVNTPYLYFGMWKATFAWHLEDMDLYSINYLHFGSPKQWYAIKPEYRKKFEMVMQNIFSQDYKKCKEFLRHKTFIVSPALLANNGIPVQRCVQHRGEFMITFPYGYHAGYNLGFNCAESVNFALDSWLSIGKVANSCQCIHDSVKIDVSIFDKQKVVPGKIAGAKKKEIE